MAHPAKVFLVDDHPIVRMGLTQLIAHEPDLSVCGEGEDAAGALQAMLRLQPDIAILDLTLQHGDGIDLIKSIRARIPAVKILVLSMHDELFIVERAFRAGASGYLPKQEASGNVLAAIRKVLRGDVYVGGDLSPRLMRKLLTGAPEGEDDAVGRLSDRELQVFRRIGAGSGTQEIAEAMNLSVKTIETYREHIKEKLNLKDGRQLMQRAIRWHLDHGGQ